MNDLVTLAQAGPVAILLVGIVAIVRAFLTGSIVPGWVYKREVAAREKSDIQAERNADSLELNAKSLAALAKASVDGRADAGPSSHA